MTARSVCSRREPPREVHSTALRAIQPADLKSPKRRTTVQAGPRLDRDDRPPPAPPRHPADRAGLDRLNALGTPGVHEPRSGTNDNDETPPGQPRSGWSDGVPVGWS